MRLGMAGNADKATPEVPGYVIMESLGRGGMGEVFRARQESLDREVSVKILRTDLPATAWLPERFELEARTMGALRHPNVVTVHDCVRLHDGRVAIVMELVRGGSLRERLNAAPDGLPLVQALQWAREIADGLRAAHAEGLIHRDVKPDNVLIDASGAARVGDFGLAFSTLQDTARLTQTGTSPGTPGYMAPELWRGAEAGVHTDIFSYATMLYEMLTGRLPQGNFPPARKLRPELTETLDRGILAALDPDPSQRPQDMMALLRALTIPPAILTRRRVLAAGALTAVAGGAGWWWAQRGPSPREFPAVSSEWEAIPWPQEPQASTVKGDWRIEKGVLLSGNAICILPLPGALRPSCTLRLRFTRMAGVLSVALFFRTPNGTGVCTLDARGQHLGGVQSVNGDVLNPDTSFYEPLENMRSYDWTIEFRPGRVRMWLDRVLRNDRDLTGAALSVPETWQWTPPPDAADLHLGSWNSPTRFERLEKLIEADTGISH